MSWRGEFDSLMRLLSSGIKLLLLCEVALGKMNQIYKAEYMEKAPAGTDSTKGMGLLIPDS